MKYTVHVWSAPERRGALAELLSLFRLSCERRAINARINTRAEVADHPASGPCLPPLTSLRGARAEKNYTVHFLSLLPPHPPVLFVPLSLSPSLPPVSGSIHVVTTRKRGRLWPFELKKQKNKKTIPISIGHLLIVEGWGRSRATPPGVDGCARTSRPKFHCKYPVAKRGSCKNKLPAQAKSWQMCRACFKCHSRGLWRRKQPNSCRQQDGRGANSSSQTRFKICIIDHSERVKVQYCACKFCSCPQTA